MSSAFDTWTRYDEGRKQIIKTQLDRILATDGISPDMAEMVGRMAKA